MTHGNEGALRRLFAAAFCADFQLYVIMTAVPFKALWLGAGPFELGTLAAISTGTYALLVGFCGRWSDRLPKVRLARSSCVGILIACTALTLAPSVGWMMACIPLVGGSMAPFWPSLQGSIATRSPVGQLDRNVGKFNLSWSTGKSLGFLCGGALVSAFGPAAAFTLASAVAFTIFFVLPGDPAPAARSIDMAAHRPHDAAIDPRAAELRRVAWIANAVSFGLAATLNHHYPRVVQEFGWNARIFGFFLGLINLTQAAAFAVMMARPRWWLFGRLRLYVAQVLMLLTVLALPFAELPRVFVAAVVFGCGLGLCYYSSLYYSLHTPFEPGRNAGVHEGLIGLGSMLVPFIGGLLASKLGMLAAPYVVAAAAIAIGLLAQELAYRSARPAS